MSGPNRYLLSAAVLFPSLYMLPPLAVLVGLGSVPLGLTGLALRDLLLSADEPAVQEM